MEQLKKIISNIPHEIKIICPLKKGQISEIYLCNFNNIKSVIRLDLEIPGWLKIQRDSEIRILDLNNNDRSEKNILSYINMLFHYKTFLVHWKGVLFLDVFVFYQTVV